MNKPSKPAMKIALSTAIAPIVGVIVLCVMALFAGPAGAQQASAPAPAPTVNPMCHTISDRDASLTCLAKSRKDGSYCMSVRNADKRAECLAESKRVKQ